MRVGKQYRVLMTTTGVRVFERDESCVFARLDDGMEFIFPEDHEEWLMNHRDITGFVKWLTEWVDV